MRIAAGAAALSSAVAVGTAFAQDGIPQPTSTGPGCWEWTYTPGQPIPGDAKVIPGVCPTPDGRCYVVPSKGCFEITGVEKPLFQERPYPPAELPIDPAGPLFNLPPIPAAPPAFRPAHPKGHEAPPLPFAGQCSAGTGWDFETFLDNTTVMDPSGTPIPVLRGFATFQGWRGDGNPTLTPSPFLDQRDIEAVAAPVYGNAVPIERIRPPGWRSDMPTRIGGDYWRYSQDINQSGDFWIGTRDRRYSWRQHPGDTWDEKAKGTLTSPDCRLQARFLTFRLGGSPHGSQRVEVHVKGGRIREYFGIRFQGGPGDPAFGGAQGYGTQLIGPSAPQMFPPPVDADGWTVVRSAAPVGDTDWMQVFVFDLRRYVGRPIRIRIVDDRRDEWWQDVQVVQQPEHLQADDFRFADEPPPGTEWMRHSDGLCGGPTAGPRCSPIGRVPSQPPLWGVTDVHAHPMANVAFGGHVAWGDATDSLDEVYDCTHSLPAINGPGGRAAISPSHKLMSCFLHGAVTAIVTAPALAGCALLAMIPFVGSTAAVVCAAIVTAAAAVATTVPVLQGATMHGAEKASSGAVKFGALFSGLHDTLPDLDLAFMPGLMPGIDTFGDTVHPPDGDWWDPRKPWHSPRGIGKTHNAYQADMIRRAFHGGLRLGVWDVINSRALNLAADGVMTSDWAALAEGTAAAKRIVATSLQDIATVAYTPQEAERIIRGGRMAVILGAEVDELGRMRPAGLSWPRSPQGGPDSMQKQVEDLWALGIRKITPVHATNNPIGGAALFNTRYDANNYFLSGTSPDGPMVERDHPPVNVFLDGSFGPLFEDLFVGKFSLGHDPVQPASPLWNPKDWFDIDVRPGRGDDRFIGEYERITYRIGIDGADILQDENGDWLPPSEVLGDQVLKLHLLKGLSFAFHGPKCNLYNTAVPQPVDSFGPEIDLRYVQAAGHRNPLGVFSALPGQDGRAFLRAAMDKGMLIDTDHLSQNARVDLYTLAHNYAYEASWPAGQCEGKDGRCGPCATPTIGSLCGSYPTVGVHSKVRGLEIDPKVPHRKGSPAPPIESMRNAFGYNDEASRTEKEVRWVAENGGTFAVFPTGSAFIPPNTKRCTKDSDCLSYRGPGTPVCLPSAQPPFARQCVGVHPSVITRDFDLPVEVHNDCDASSKTFAVKYLWLMRSTRGRGLTPATDFNGLITTLKPRYGTGLPWNRACSGDVRGATEQPPPANGWKVLMRDSQTLEASGVWYEDYASRGPLSSFHAGGDPRYKKVVARAKLEEREDRAPRAKVDDLVFFNDFGPDISPSPKYQMGNRPGAQLWAMKRWQVVPGRAGWDYNLDGLQHIGLYPDLFQDMRNVGVQWEQMGPLFHSASEYIATWKRATAIAAAHP